MKDKDKRSEAIKQYMETAHKVNHMLHAKFHNANSNSHDDCSISHEALHVLYLISKHAGTSIKDICDKNKKSRMLNWKLVKQLEDKELITKIENSLDKRKPLHFITPKGEEIVKGRTDLIFEVLTEVTAHFSDKELDLLVKLNKKILEYPK